MDTLRAFFRLLAIIGITLLAVLLLILGTPFCLGDNNRKVRLKNFIMNYWAMLVARVMGISITITGSVPQPPFLLVSNHLSYVDIIPFWYTLKTTFIAKSEINKWPVIGRVASLLGIVFINREKNRDLNRVNKVIEENLSSTQGLILFPEGTSSRGKRVLPFKSSLLQNPAQQEWPVHHASLRYELPPNSPHKAWKEICWWGDMEFAPHFWNMLHIKSFKIYVQFGGEPVKKSNRKELANTLHQKVQEHFKPTNQP